MTYNRFGNTEGIMIKSLLGILSAASLLLGATPWGHAQDYPRNPINLLLPMAAGDGGDIAARSMAEDLAGSLKVPIVVINRPGAAGALTTDIVLKARKDGYTIMLTNNANMTLRRLVDPQAAAYDPLKDLTALGLATRIPSVLVVRSDAPFKSFGELVEFAKMNPGKVRVGTPGVGSVGDFNVAAINAITGAGIVMVPFAGSAPVVTALRGGHVEGVAVSLGSVSSQLKSGAMRAIAISSKFPEFPDIPTLAELGYRQNLLGVWMAFFAPAGVPAEVTNALVPAIEKAVKVPAIVSKLAVLGMAQDYLPPEKFLAEVRDESRRVEEIARKAGIVK